MVSESPELSDPSKTETSKPPRAIARAVMEVRRLHPYLEQNIFKKCSPRDWPVAYLVKKHLRNMKTTEDRRLKRAKAKNQGSAGTRTPSPPTSGERNDSGNSADVGAGSASNIRVTENNMPLPPNLITKPSAGNGPRIPAISEGVVPDNPVCSKGNNPGKRLEFGKRHSEGTGGEAKAASGGSPVDRYCDSVPDTDVPEPRSPPNIEEVNSEDILDDLFTLYGPEKGATICNGWSSHKNPVAKAYVSGPNAMYNGTVAPPGCRYVTIHQLASHEGMKLFDVPFKKAYKAGDPGHRTGNFAEKVEKLITNKFIWAVDLIFMPRRNKLKGYTELAKTPQHCLPDD